VGYEQSDDYIDVNERIIEFRLKHPEGSLRQKSLQFITVPTTPEVYSKSNRSNNTDLVPRMLVVYTAQAFRHPEDPAPGEGTAAEFFPGKTPYTYDSEVQNAETAAWGRALIAVGAADAKAGLASREEVVARQEPEEESLPDPLFDAVNRLIKASKAAKVNLPDEWAKKYDGEDVRQCMDIQKIIAQAVEWELQAQ
jgi:hypothetical protein